MKISRWIYFPLIYTIILILYMLLDYWILGEPRSSFSIWFLTIYFLISGFVTLFFSDRKARKLSENDERVFEVKQSRKLTLLLNKEKTFCLCREAILSLKRGRILSEDFANDEIKGRGRSNYWDLCSESIEIRLMKINENLTEVEIFVRPVWKTVMVSSGQSWQTAEEICNYLNEKDAEINKKVLVDSAVILDDVYVKPFRKEKVER